MKVTMIVANLRQDNLRLQPGRYLTEIAAYLHAQGYVVTIITDTGRWAPNSSQLGGILIRLVGSIRCSTRQDNRPLQAAIDLTDPDILLWVLGQSSFWHFRWPPWLCWPVVVLFTSPVYRPAEVLRLGAAELAACPRFYSFFLWASLVPSTKIRRLLNHGDVLHTIALSHSVGRRLQASGVTSERLRVIRPGIDPRQAPAATYQEKPHKGRLPLRGLYLGSPQRYRGPDMAIKILPGLSAGTVSLQLDILSRRTAGQFEKDEWRLSRLAHTLRVANHVRIISGILSPEEVQRHLDQADIILLPFKLIASETPLTILEAMRLGKPVVTTSLPAMVDLMNGEKGVVVAPGNALALAEAVRRLGESPEKRFRIGKSASQYMADWPSWSDTGRAFVEMLGEIA